MKKRDDKIPLVSCVITSYKRDRQIVERALQSILNQTYKNTEIIIVDDNREGDESYSGGIESLAKLSDKIIVIKSEGGHGAQRARNTGIAHARGDFVAFLDDDDEWIEDKLKAQLECMAKHPKAGLCYCDGYLVDETLNPPIERPFKGKNFKSRVTYKELLRDDIIGTTSQAMIKKQVFKSCGMFDESFPARQDYEMWIRISRSFPVVGVPKCLFRYHKAKGADQISHKWRGCIEGHQKIYQKYKRDIDSDRAAKFNVVFHIAHYYAMGWHSEKNVKYKRQAIKYYMTAFFTSPILFARQGSFRIRHEIERKFRRI